MGLFEEDEGLFMDPNGCGGLMLGFEPRLSAGSRAPVGGIAGTFGGIPADL
jgi:hypothetical protein